MATAKKLPSGSWRCLAYSHTERIYDEKIKKWKNKRIYESFTDDDPSPAGRKNGPSWLPHSFRQPRHLTGSGNGRIMENSPYPRQSTNILNPGRT